MIPPLALFGISIAFSFITWGIVLARYLLPELRRQSRADAMQPLILLHCFRFVGLSFLVPGVVSPDLPPAWAVPAAYGDLIAAVLALLALAALKSRLGVVLVWVFNLWGSADLLYAFYQGNQVGLEPGQLGAAYFIVTVLVPLLLITHGSCSGSCYSAMVRRPRAKARVCLEAHEGGALRTGARMTVRISICPTFPSVPTYTSRRSTPPPSSSRACRKHCFSSMRMTCSATKAKLMGESLQRRA